MDPVYHLDKPRNFNPKLLFVVATGSAGGRGRMCLAPEWGKKKKEAVECSLGETFRRGVSFTLPDQAGAESLQPSE
ncbi:rCG23789 [Rattus norvegicus]|uniref:RCG23789 n=1 Tax=Rattus norvegicus TaxID=10116 RepID=A6JVR2_RAT|nr:rCG23789 [Rattus norvegicus]